MDRFQRIEERFRLSQEFCNREMHYFLTLFDGMSEQFVTVEQIIENYKSNSGIDISRPRVEQMIRTLMHHDLFAESEMPIISKHELPDGKSKTKEVYVFDSNMFMLTQIGDYYKN